jgi:hypothetical protein
MSRISSPSWKGHPEFLPDIDAVEDRDGSLFDLSDGAGGSNSPSSHSNSMI